MRSNVGPRCRISEVFSSFQGEGPYLGVKQIFVRFEACNLSCVYCDEKQKSGAGKGFWTDTQDLLRRLSLIEKKHGPHGSVSLTGGEPLVETLFLKEFLPKLRKKRTKLYLETNGTLPDSLEQIIGNLNIISMDVKPVSSAGQADLYGVHERFLEIASRKEVFVKLVVTSATRAADIDRYARLVRKKNPSIPFILQPESRQGRWNQKALRVCRDRFLKIAQRYVRCARVIPQMHKIWGVR